MSEKTKITSDSPEKPPQYEDVMQEDEVLGVSNKGKENKGYNADISEVKVKMADGTELEVVDDDGGEKVALSEEEEQMLSVLREVVRRCTHANPLKRPTASEVLKLLKTVKIPELENEYEK